MKFSTKRYISIKINSMYITRDALSLRYHRIDYKKGGLVNQRHNKVRDALGDLAAIVYKDVVRKPIVQEADDSSASIRRVR